MLFSHLYNVCGSTGKQQTSSLQAIIKIRIFSQNEANRPILNLNSETFLNLRNVIARLRDVLFGELGLAPIGYRKALA